MLIGHHIFPSFPQPTFWPCHWSPCHMAIYNSQVPNYHFRKQVTLYHFILSKITQNNEWLQYKKCTTVFLYLIVHIIIFHLCKVFLSLRSCFARFVVILETIIDVTCKAYKYITAKQEDKAHGLSTLLGSYHMQENE